MTKPSIEAVYDFYGLTITGYGHGSSLIDLSGRRFERWRVLHRVEDQVLSSGRRLPRWLCVCDCGTVQANSGQNLRSGQTKSCGCLNRELMAAVGRRNRIAGQVTYNTVHHRTRKMKGRAALHACIDCGEPAREWSYDYSDPDEWTEPTPSGGVLRYSGKPEHYVPRCKPCHTAFDRGRNGKAEH